MPEPLDADDLERLAFEALATAEQLAGLHNWKAAYYHAGVAVELALKHRIMRAKRLNQWPERGPYHIHDLTRLSDHAGLQADLLAEVGASTDIGIAWLVAKDWSIGVRYDARSFPPRRGSDMVEAVGKRGLVRWLLTQ